MTPEILFGIGALALLAALVFGFVAYKTRNRRNDAITEAATREEYDHPERYEDATKERMKQDVR